MAKDGGQGIRKNRRKRKKRRPRSNIGATGTTLASYTYDAFGNLLTSQKPGDAAYGKSTGNTTGSSFSNSVTYRGYEYDSDTGLYYLNARYYDSETARFLSEDTYRGTKEDPLSLHLYEYCAGNPIRYSDPSGHLALSFALGTGIICLISVPLFAYTIEKNTDFKKASNEIAKYIEEAFGVAITNPACIYIGTAGTDIFVISGVNKAIVYRLKNISESGKTTDVANQQGGGISPKKPNDNKNGLVKVAFTVLGSVLKEVTVDVLEECLKDVFSSEGSLNSRNPQSYLEKALNNQGLDSAPDRMKEVWVEGDYKYTVRIHEGNTAHTNAESIYRVSRQSTILDSNGQGTGLEYLGTDGNWYHESVLKEFLRGGSPNPIFNEEAARMTHIPLGGK